MTEAEEETSARLGVCGYPCAGGGSSAARKFSRSDLGWMGHCNRPVPSGRCWAHREEANDG